MCIQSLLTAALIACSTNGFIELFHSWPMATAKSLSVNLRFRVIAWWICTWVNEVIAL